MSDLIPSNDYKPFLQDILTRIQSARYEMLKSVSKQTILLYQDRGKSVSEKTQTKKLHSTVKFLFKELFVVSGADDATRTRNQLLGRQWL